MDDNLSFIPEIISRGMMPENWRAAFFAVSLEQSLLCHHPSSESSELSKLLLLPP